MVVGCYKCVFIGIFWKVVIVRYFLEVRSSEKLVVDTYGSKKEKRVWVFFIGVRMFVLYR